MILNLTALPRQVPGPLRRAARLLPVVALALCLWLMASHVSPVDGGAIVAALGAIGPGRLVLALLFAAVSFAAIGGFELTVRRMLGLTGPRVRAARAGMAAIALAQVVGFGALTSALARWRALPELGLARATELSVAVSVVFMAGLGGFAALALSLAQGAFGLTLGLGALSVALILRLAPGARLPGLGPARGAQAALWVLADICAGALVLFVLLPGAARPDALLFLTAYATALIAGFLSQSPGGLGAFEMSLLALLPAIPQDGFLAALLAYRLVYHLLPALVGLALLARPQPAPPPVALQPARGAGRLRALAQAPSGDWALVHQGAQVLLRGAPFCGWLVQRTGGWLVALGDPVGPGRLADLTAVAQVDGQSPALYRVGPRTAAAARRAGWQTLRIAQEAVLYPQTWSPDAAACRSLRRKLRQADAAGVAVTIEPADLPLAQMATIAALWSARHGGERGFSMGRFSPALVRQAVVVLGWQRGQLVGFITLNRGRDCWSLDLMRAGPAVPDGTMQALVAAAITAARAAGVARVSLASVPCPPGWLPRPVARHLSRDGLRQFKASFAPRWQPRYLAAPGRIGLLTALVAIARAIHWPGPLQNIAPPHGDHAAKAFDSAARPCDGPDPNATPAQAPLPVRPPERRPHDQRPRPPA